jgi:hypothetical protein
MGFVDYHEIEVIPRVGFSAQRFEGQEWKHHISAACLLRPHVAQSSGTHDDTAEELSGNRKRDECLSHSDFVREKRSAKLFDRRKKPPPCGQLVRVQRH